MTEPARIDLATVVPLRPMAGFASVLEPDDAEALDAIEERTRQRVNDLRWHAAVPQRFHRVTLDFYSPAIAEDLAAWGRDPAGRNLVLFGPVGTGKTGGAIAACRHASDRGLNVRYLPVVELFDLLRPGGSDEGFEAIADVDRLIVDDLGTERPTEWTAERLYAVVNRRWSDSLPTVYTTNLDPAALEAHVGERMFSRIVGSDAVCIRLAGTDRRRRP